MTRRKKTRYREVPKLSTPLLTGVYLTLGYFTATAVRSSTPKGVLLLR